jgi:magnesium transporter
VITDCAVYHHGQRHPGKLSLEEACAAAAEPDSFVWLGLCDPTAAELASVRAAFDLHPRAVQDTPTDHDRPTMSVDGDVLFTVIKTARFIEPRTAISLGQVVMFAGPWFVVTVRYGDGDGDAGARKELEAHPELLRNGPCTVMYAIVDRIVDDYVSVLGGLDAGLREAEQEVFTPDVRQPTERIYLLIREVLGFQRAIAPLVDMLLHLAAGKYPVVPESVRAYFGGVEDRLLRVREEVERDRALLTSMLEASSAQVAMRQTEVGLEQTRIALRQNEDMRKISAWVGIVAVPTMIAGVYGMNFQHMPELGWLLGYPLALTVMGGASLLLYLLFRRSGWL